MDLGEKIAAIRERCEGMLAKLDRTGDDQISLTAPGSRAMAAHTHVGVGYTVQVAVDAKHKLVVEQQVTNQVVDMGLMTPTAEPAKEILGVERIAVVAEDRSRPIMIAKTDRRDPSRSRASLTDPASKSSSQAICLTSAGCHWLICTEASMSGIGEAERVFHASVCHAVVDTRQLTNASLFTGSSREDRRRATRGNEGSEGP